MFYNAFINELEKILLSLIRYQTEDTRVSTDSKIPSLMKIETTAYKYDVR